MSMAASTFRWFQRKRYQYEVTFSLYMLTPTEKFIFNSFIFLFFSMIVIAATLYLPHHLSFLFTRAWFYYAGEEYGKAAASGVSENPLALSSLLDTAAGTASLGVEKVVETVQAVWDGGKEL